MHRNRKIVGEMFLIIYFNGKKNKIKNITMYEKYMIHNLIQKLGNVLPSFANRHNILQIAHFFKHLNKLVNKSPHLYLNLEKSFFHFRKIFLLTKVKQPI